MTLRCLTAVLAMIAVAALAIVTFPAEAGATDGVPYGDGRHWARSSGSETVVYVDDNGGSLRPLVENSAKDWSRSSTLLVIPVSDCPAARNCIYLFPETHGGCGGDVTHGNMTTYQGHVHIGATLVGIDPSSCSLGAAQYLTCNLMGRSLGVQTGGNFSPCGEGDLLHPTVRDVDVATILHAQVHVGTIYPTGV